MTYLDEIIKNKEREIAILKIEKPIASLTKSDLFNKKCNSMRDSILRSNNGIISEFKRKSPSKGFINEKADLESVVAQYQQSGAAAVSVLADKKFFAAQDDDHSKAARILSIPLFYKEFIIDEYQIFEAKSKGADAILLIAAILDQKKCEELAQTAKFLGMETVLEIHCKDEISLLNANINMAGINNRNLRTFETNIENSIQLSKEISDNFVKISESGISSPETVNILKNNGFKGFLIGENFMKTENPGLALQTFIKGIKK